MAYSLVDYAWDITAEINSPNQNGARYIEKWGFPFCAAVKPLRFFIRVK